MKIAVISDIHGNMDAFGAVLRDIQIQCPEQVYSLGDNIGYGAEPEQVMRCLQDRNIPSILGNHELAVIESRHLNWFNPSARRSLEKTRQMLSEEMLDVVRSWHPFRSAGECRMVHGFPPDLVKYYLFQASGGRLVRTFNRLKERICFVGHTHELELIGYDGRTLERQLPGEGVLRLDPNCRYIVNVGSVGQPRDGDPRAKYAIWDDGAGMLEIRFISYDVESAVEKILSAGLPEIHAYRLR